MISVFQGTTFSGGVVAVHRRQSARLGGDLHRDDQLGRRPRHPGRASSSSAAACSRSTARTPTPTRASIPITVTVTQRSGGGPTVSNTGARPRPADGDHGQRRRHQQHAADVLGDGPAGHDRQPLRHAGRRLERRRSRSARRRSIPPATGASGQPAAGRRHLRGHRHADRRVGRRRCRRSSLGSLVIDTQGPTVASVVFDAGERSSSASPSTTTPAASTRPPWRIPRQLLARPRLGSRPPQLRGRPASRRCPGPRGAASDRRSSPSTSAERPPRATTS